MPLQNRVDPWGRLHAVQARGTLLGNRGILHNVRKAIVITSARQGWVTCLLEFEGRKRTIFGAGTYSELFFLDEATAFSAGHRPCAECRRARYNEFKAAWVRGNPGLAQSGNPPIAEIDKIVHAERVSRSGGKLTFDAPLADLPRGTFIEVGAEGLLVWEKELLRWSFEGYSSYPVASLPNLVRVLTPRSVVQTFRSGFVPTVHASAKGL